MTAGDARPTVATVGNCDFAPSALSERQLPVRPLITAASRPETEPTPVVLEPDAA